jgi:hypothetical protein
MLQVVFCGRKTAKLMRLIWEMEERIASHIPAKMVHGITVGENETAASSQLSNRSLAAASASPDYPTASDASEEAEASNLNVVAEADIEQKEMAATEKSTPRRKRKLDPKVGVEAAQLMELEKKRMGGGGSVSVECARLEVVQQRLQLSRKDLLQNLTESA